MKYPGCSLEDMVGYVKPVARKKLDTLVIHVETNELTKGVITMKKVQKQSSRGVPRKRYSENMRQIYRRTPMPKCDFNKVALQLY